jgi:hypothetical protein
MQMDTPPIPRRKTTIDISRDTVDVTFELTVPKGHPLADSVKRGEVEYVKLAFTQNVFGVVSVNNQPLTANEISKPFWESDQKTGNLLLTVEGSRRVSGLMGVQFRWAAQPRRDPGQAENVLGLAASLLAAGAAGLPAGVPWAALALLVGPQPADEVLSIKLSEVSLRYCSVPLDSSDQESMTVRRPAGGQSDTLYLYVDPFPKPDDAISHQTYLRRIGQAFGLSGISEWWVASQLARGVLEALPLLAFLWLLTRRPPAQSTAGYREVLLTVLTFHAVTCCLDLILSASLKAPFTAASMAIEDWWGSYVVTYQKPVLGYGAILIAPAIFGVLVPALVLRNWGVPAPTLRPSRAGWAAGGPSCWHPPEESW